MTTADPPQGGGAAATPETPPLATVTTVSPLFKLVFLSVTALTVLLLLLHVALAVGLESPSTTQQELIDTVQTAWQVGFSGMLGLIGGKAL